MRTVTTQQKLNDVSKTGEWVKIEAGDFWVLRENSHAVLRENSHAVLRENSHAELWGNSHAELWGNSHAELWENSHAVLRGNSHAELWDFSVGHQLSKLSKIKKGSHSTVITPNYPKNIRDWAKLKGLKIHKNTINLFKVLRLDGTDFHSRRINYLTDAVAPDWDKKFKGECGYGLHLADSPGGAKNFLQDRNNYLLIEVNALIKDCICFGGQPDYPIKLRARACRFVRIIEKVENGRIVPI